MKEVEYRTECATCGRVINREFVEQPDYYKKIIVTNGICRLCRNKRHYKPDYDREAAALHAEDIRRIQNLIYKREKVK
jgi:hypothetical protein